MSDLYTIDHDAVRRIIERRGYDFATASKVTGVHLNTVRRLAADYVPEGMSEERASLAHIHIVAKLANGLRVKPQYFAPDLPESSPEPSPPKKPTIYGKPQGEAPGDWRSMQDTIDRRKRLVDLVAEELEYAS